MSIVASVAALGGRFAAGFSGNEGGGGTGAMAGGGGGGAGPGVPAATIAGGGCIGAVWDGGGAEASFGGDGGARTASGAGREASSGVSKLVSRGPGSGGSPCLRRPDSGRFLPGDFPGGWVSATRAGGGAGGGAIPSG
jgi:hypothetical protein